MGSLVCFVCVVKVLECAHLVGISNHANPLNECIHMDKQSAIKYCIQSVLWKNTLKHTHTHTGQKQTDLFSEVKAEYSYCICQEAGRNKGQ